MATGDQKNQEYNLYLASYLDFYSRLRTQRMGQDDLLKQAAG